MTGLSLIRNTPVAKVLARFMRFSLAKASMVMRVIAIKVRKKGRAENRERRHGWTVFNTVRWSITKSSSGARKSALGRDARLRQ